MNVLVQVVLLWLTFSRMIRVAMLEWVLVMVWRVVDMVVVVVI